MTALGSSTIGLRLESLEDLCASACNYYMVKITKTGSDKSTVETYASLDFISSSSL